MFLVQTLKIKLYHNLSPSNTGLNVFGTLTVSEVFKYI